MTSYRSSALVVTLIVFTLAQFRTSAVAQADTGNQAQSDLVKQANAPISSVLQLRLQNSYAPAFQGGLHGQGNSFSVQLTMPLPEYRLLPLPQLSLLTIPAANTLPLPEGSQTGFGDVRFLDIAIIDAGHRVLFGVGPTFVFPTANQPATGQGKWQIGPAAAVAFAPKRWLIGVLAQNPISFAGDPDRPAANALYLQPFITYQLDGGWFIRSQPQMIFDWETGRQLLPLSLGFGRVFKIGRQQVNCFIEPAWNASHDGPAPRYVLEFGFSLLYPNFWGRWAAP